MALTSRRDADAFARLLDAPADAPDASPDGAPAGSPELLDLARLARSLPRPAVSADPVFVARLREDLVAAADARAATLTAARPEPAPGATPEPGRTTSSPRPSGPRTLVVRRPGRLLPVALATVVGLAVLLVGLSTRALPGDRLYPVKVGLGQAQVRLAGSDLARGRALLGQVDARLDDVSRLVASGDPDPADVDLALEQAAVDLTRAQRVLLAGDGGHADPQALQSLADASAVAAGRLAQLSSSVPTASLPALHRLQTLLAVGDAAVRQQVKACGSACGAVSRQLDAAGPLALPDGVVGGLSVPVGSVGGPTRGSPTTSTSGRAEPGRRGRRPGGRAPRSRSACRPPSRPSRPGAASACPGRPCSCRVRGSPCPASA